MGETEGRIQKAYQDIIEAQVAVATDEENTMTYLELADLLDVKRNPDNSVPGVELFNACMNVSDNPKVQKLPLLERLRVIRSAVFALDNLCSGNLA